MSGLKVTWRKGIAYLSGTIDGRRIRKSLSTRDEEIAKSARAQEEARLQKAAIYGTDHEATFADACILYLEEGGERRYMTQLITNLGRKRLRDIHPGTFKALAQKLYPGLKPQTLNRYILKPGQAVINTAHQHGLCGPMSIKKFRELPIKKKKAVDKNWLVEFRAHAINPRIRCAALFMFVTGSRPSELIPLTKDHFDLNTRAGISEITKNGEYRAYYLTEQLANELSALEPRKIGWGQFAGERRIFGYADTKGIRQAWIATCKAASIEYIPPGQCGRHSFATEAITKHKIDPKTVGEIGNWKDCQILLKHYVHPEGLHDTVEATFGDIAALEKPKLRRVK